jgi:hypothetical protein
MDKNLRRASELIEKLKALAKEATSEPPRSGDLVAIDQMAVFGELLFTLALYMDKAQRRIKLLSAVLTVLTALLVLEAAPRLEKLLFTIYHRVQALL